MYTSFWQVLVLSKHFYIIIFSVLGSCIIVRPNGSAPINCSRFRVAIRPFLFGSNTALEFNGIEWHHLSDGMVSISTFRPPMYSSHDGTSSAAILFEHLWCHHISFGELRCGEKLRCMKTDCYHFTKNLNISFSDCKENVLRINGVAHNALSSDQRIDALFVRMKSAKWNGPLKLWHFCDASFVLPKT